MTQLTFEAFDLDAPLQRSLEARGFSAPTPIQAAAIPELLDGRDLIGLAQTGTGKTAAFTLPLVQNLADERDDARPKPGAPRALILAPTRELAVQIDETVQAFAPAVGLESMVIVGGVPRRGQERRLSRPVDIVVGTPGRVHDLATTGELKLGAVTDFVLDEADQMLDLGFIPDIRRIAKRLPTDRQTAMFSATWPPHIAKLAGELLNDPIRITADQTARERPTPPEKIAQTIRYVADKGARVDALRDAFADSELEHVIVFTRTKRGANRVAEILAGAGVPAAAIHGNKSQNARQAALSKFSSREIRALVATDIAARGIDVKGVSHVVNFDMPTTAETYVHRIGRTARAGAAGAAISFCGPDELDELKAVEKLLGIALPKEGERPKAQREPSDAPKRGRGGPPARAGRPRASRGSGANASGKARKGRRSVGT